MSWSKTFALPPAEPASGARLCAARRGDTTLEANCGDVAVLGSEVIVCGTGDPMPVWVCALDGTVIATMHAAGRGYHPKTDGRRVLYHDGEAFHAWVLGGADQVLPGVPVGNNPTGISRNGLAFFQRADLAGGVYGPSGKVAAYRPTGIWEAHDDGSVLMMDDARMPAWAPGAGGYAHRCGEVTVAEAPTGGILVYRAGARRLLWPGTDTMWPRVSVAGDRVAIVCWRDYTLRVWAGTLADLDALPVDQAPVVVPPAPPHLRGFGYFFRDSQQYGDNPAAPCTHSVIVDEPRSLPAEPLPDGTPVRMILGLPCLLHEHLDAWWSLVDAVYVAAEGDVARLERDAALARQIMAHRQLAPKPLIGYTGRQVYPQALEPTDLLAVQLYLERGEGAASLRHVAAELASQLGDRRVALIAMAFDRLGWFTGAELAALQPVYYEIASAWPTCEYLLAFSDGRPGGTRTHEALRPWHAAITTAIREAHR